MSNDAKGTRKTKKSTKTGAAAPGGLKLTTELLIALLVAGLYAVFLVETSLDRSLTGLLLSMFLCVAFLVFLVIVRGGTHRLKGSFSSLLYVFLGLSVLGLVWELLLYLKLVDAASLGLATWIVAVGGVNAIASLVILAALVLLQKTSPRELYLTIGDTKVIPLAAGAFILCLCLGIGATYLLFGGSALGQDKLVPLVIAVVTFGIVGSIVEELWFRGLLLAKITPILGDSYGNIYQAVVFGVFEAVVFYLLTGEVGLMPAMFLIGAMTGYYWGRATQRSKSLISPILLHAGFYVLITLPLIVRLIS